MEDAVFNQQTVDEINQMKSTNDKKIQAWSQPMLHAVPRFSK